MYHLAHKSGLTIDTLKNISPTSRENEIDEIESELRTVQSHLDYAEEENSNLGHDLDHANEEIRINKIEIEILEEQKADFIKTVEELTVNTIRFTMLDLSK